MSERLSPERAVRLLRAKTDELELVAPIFLMEPPPTPDAIGQALGSLMADIALVASLLADHIERAERLDAEKLAMIAEVKGMTTVVVQHDASFNEPVIETEMTDPKDRLTKLPWVKFDTPGPGEPGDASDAT